jgi:hypothetical protein
VTTGLKSGVPLYRRAALLGSAPFRAADSGGNEFVCKAPPVGDVEQLILVLFESARYPLERHCRFALHKDSESPYTFPNFLFKDTPPGTRVGPWPGWRGIPEMPATSVSVGGRRTRLEFQFWGDEAQCHIMRGVAKIGIVKNEEIAIYTSDSRLVPTEARFYSVVPLNPEPYALEIHDALLQQHPRLLITGSDHRSLRTREPFGRVAELLKRWEQPQVITPESKIASGPEGLSPEDKALVGAFLALVDPSPSSAQRGIKSLLQYADFTRQPDFTPLTIDTQSGEVLFLLCVGYDWLFHQMNDGERRHIQTRLREIAEICWSHLGYERTDYAQAHYLGCGMGLLAYSLLFWNEHPRAREWCNHLVGVLNLVLSLLPPDGFFAHGINLWIYEFGFLLRWLELLRSGGGLDLWAHESTMSQASAFRAAATSPDGLYGITFGDPQYRVGGDSWCHYLIALRTRSAQARSLGDLLRDLPVDGVDFRNAPARRRVYECLWYPTDIVPEPVMAGTHVFADGGQFFCRTPDTLLTFRAGPPLGNHRYDSGLTGGYGHSDPCNGAFLLYANGSLALAGPGPVYRRDTALHNVVAINGRGQFGDSAVWMPDFIPPSQLSPTPELRLNDHSVSATVELSHSYLPDLGVRSLRRSILVEPGHTIVGVDLVDLDNDSSVEWNLHSWRDFNYLDTAPRFSFRIGGGDSRPITVFCYSAHPATWQRGESGFVPAYPNDGLRDRFLRVVSIGREVAFFWCILLDGDPPTFAPDSGHRGTWTFGNGTTLHFDGVWISREGTK